MREDKARRVEHQPRPTEVERELNGATVAPELVPKVLFPHCVPPAAGAPNGAATNGVGSASASPPPCDSDAALSDDGDADGDGGASPSRVKGTPPKRSVFAAAAHGQALYQQASGMCCSYMPLHWAVGNATCADDTDRR